MEAKIWKVLSELEEMSNRRKEQTGLPVNIWIDEAQAYITGGYSKRIKFQLNKSNKIGVNPLLRWI